MSQQSLGLSKRLTRMVKDGRRLNDDSFSSEGTLAQALREIIPYIKDKCQSIGATLEYKKSMTLYECQGFFHRALSGGTEEKEKEKVPPPNEENKKVSMKPDGGIFIMKLNNGTHVPLLIIEDKVQGTNDLIYEQKGKRQATGNAIERGAKNIRGAEMIFTNQPIFPYIMFASGCDFHHSETIAKRIEMMNYGIPNHYIGLTITTSQDEVDAKIKAILDSININKVFGKSVASVFIKAHKYDEMKHGSSLWKKNEIVVITKKVVDKVFESFA